MNLRPSEQWFGWTPEREERAAAEWRQGKSASQISALLGGGLSRNAVIGKIHRLGLAGRTKAPAAPSRQAPLANPTEAEGERVRRATERAQRHNQWRAQARRPTHEEALLNGEERRAEFRAEFATPPVVKTGGITIIDLTESTCRWPHGDPRSLDEFRYCGDAIEPGRSYCPDHCRLAYDGFGRSGRKLENQAAIV